jgi:hypothetical protein
MRPSLGFCRLLLTIAVALVGIFVIPMLYVVFQWLRERSARQVGHQKASDGAASLTEPGE